VMIFRDEIRRPRFWPTSRFRSGSPDIRLPGGVTHVPSVRAPVQAAADLETMVEPTRSTALEGTRLELELPGGTRWRMLDPARWPVYAWAMRLAGVASGGRRSRFCKLRVAQPQTACAVEGSTGVVLSLSCLLRRRPLAALSWCRPCRGRPACGYRPRSSSRRCWRSACGQWPGAVGSRGGDQSGGSAVMVPPEQLNEAEESPLTGRLAAARNAMSREELGGGPI